MKVLEEGEFKAVGGARTIKVDVRASLPPPTATSPRRSQKGNFREDLFYRLYVIPMTLPSLRERPEDIPYLINYFLSSPTGRNRR